MKLQTYIITGNSPQNPRSLSSTYGPLCSFPNWSTSCEPQTFPYGRSKGPSSTPGKPTQVIRAWSSAPVVNGGNIAFTTKAKSRSACHQ